MREFQSEGEKADSQCQRSDRIEQMRPTVVRRKQADEYQKEEWQQCLQTHHTASQEAVRKDDITRALVVVAVHPRDCHEMRKLPAKHDREEQPRFGIQMPARCGPAYQ